jgi:imidazolonepropionase
MKVLKNFSQIVTLSPALKKDGRNLLPGDLGIINNGSVVFDQKKIHWVGSTENLPTEFETLPSFNCKNHILTPELVDSHTHLVFGGDRSREYSMRLNGADYQEIANQGGGIISTMEGTNKLGRNDLFELGKMRIEQIKNYGVGTIEIKSGYGLNYEKEKELSLIIDDLKKYFHPDVQIFNTFMAAHAIPPGFVDSNSYLKKIVIPLLNELHKLKIIDAIDIFFEDGYFNSKDTTEIFNLSKNLGIPIKIHADEFKDHGGASLAAEYGALSADHLLNTGPKGIKALSNSSTVATLLPGTGLFLGKKQANARELLNSGAKLAIASDYNPGSCHCDNLLLLASISAPNYRLNITELWAAITLNASHALGLKNQGVIEPGFSPRFTIFKVDSIDKITYSWGKNFNVPIGTLFK